MIAFEFRVWVHPYGGDPSDIEVWYSGLEPTDPGSRPISDWALDSLSNEDFHDLFELDKDKHYQVFGSAELRCVWFDYLGEYDEELTLINYFKAEVSEEWLYGKTIADEGDTE